ncbi:MAG TPA: hypothetical protein VFV73_16785 [Streptosporangiaceae bacterium]|nr:hypothetical protein [Streptosporangiaceae bacterium]
MTVFSEADIRAAINEFVFAATWAQSRWVLAMHPELLTGDADFVLSHIKASAREMGLTRDVELAENHQKLLRLCRDIGPQAAFAEVTGHDYPPLTADLITVCDAAAEADQSFRETQDPRQLDRAISAFEAGLQSQAGDLGRAPLETMEHVLGLAISLRCMRFDVRPGPDDIDAALVHWDALLRRASGSVAALSARSSGIGGSMLIRAHLAGRGSLTAAVEALEHAVAAGPPGADRDGAERNLKTARMLQAKR